MELNTIKQKIFSMVGCSFDGNLEADFFEGVKVKFDGKNAVIGYSTKPQFARGCMLLAKAISEGKTQVDITEVPHFKSCGLMLDMSRNGVMRVNKVKEYLDYMAAYGMNAVMLYTEDTYEVEEYPEFGYLRGSYTVDELKEIDDYAYSLGIEVIPCIQTLGHLEHFTKWGSGRALADMENVLFAGEEETYKFIEACIKTVRGALRSNRIHVGMDEAFAVGRGKYLDKHGYVEPTEIITQHLGRVSEICKKYGYQPMMWSDMYFRKKGVPNDYNADVLVDPEIAKNIPDVDMVYWDYYHADYQFYDDLFNHHEALNKTVHFAGGIWTWVGFLPNTGLTDKFSPNAMLASVNHKAHSVFGTMWGDDGAETDVFMALGQIPYVSEYCYRGADATPEDVYEIGSFVSGFDRDFYNACADFHKEVYFVGKRIMWTDIIYDMHGTNIDPDEYVAQMKAAAELMDKKAHLKDKNYRYYKYAKKIFEILTIKTPILYNMDKEYQAGNRAYFLHLAKNELPELKKKYAKLCKIHKENWFETNKPNGFEVLLERYAGILARLDYTIELFEGYGNGSLEIIEELSQRRIPGRNAGIAYKTLYSPCWK